MSGTSSIDLHLTQAERARVYSGLDRIAQAAGTHAKKTALELASLAYLALPELPAAPAQERPGSRHRIHLHHFHDQAEVIAAAIYRAMRAGHECVETALLAVIETAAAQEFLRDLADGQHPVGGGRPTAEGATGGPPTGPRPVNGGRSSHPTRKPNHVIPHGRIGNGSRDPSPPTGSPASLVPRRPGDAPPALTAGEIDRTRLASSLDPAVVSGTSTAASALGSVTSLLAAAELSMDQIERFAIDPARWYRRRTKRKRSGGRRVYYAPDPELIEIQRQLLPVIGTATPTSPLWRRTREETATPHAGGRWVVLVDVRDFYPSITASMVARLLDQLGAAPEVVELILRLTTLRERLVQGAATSSVIADLVLLDLDRRVHEEAERRRVLVTRYVDDLAFSGDDREAVEAIARVYAQGLAELSLRMRRTGTQHRGVRREFLGFGLNGQRLGIPKRKRRRIARAAQRVSKRGCRPRRGKRGQHSYKPDERMQLSGMIGQVAPLHPPWAKRMRAMLASAPQSEAFPSPQARTHAGTPQAREASREAG